MNIKTKLFSKKLSVLAVSAVALMSFFFAASPLAVSAQQNPQRDNHFGQAKGGYQCGKGPNAYKTRINFGCLGQNAKTNMNPLEDFLFAAIRFLSYGVGVVLVGSMIWAGIQYSTSEGNPESTQAAKNRIRDAVIGLFVYLFAFALVQYLVPGGLFN